MKYILIFLFLAACSSITLVVPEREVPVLAWGKERADWSEALLKEIQDKPMLAVDVSDAAAWCPTYNSLDKGQRAQVIAQLMSIMAQRESSFKPGAKYTEAFTDAKGKPVISRGLMQISIESSNSYGCGFKDVEELHDPFKNLSCSVKIIDRWLVRDKRFGGQVAGKWHGACARYWSVCRSKSRSYAEVTGYLKKLPICGGVL